MPWKKTDSLLRRRANQTGMGDMLTAGLLCRQAELLHPDLFRAVSVRKGCLHLEVTAANAIAVKLVQGKLISELNRYGEAHNLPKVTRVRLTIADPSATL